MKPNDFLPVGMMSRIEDWTNESTHLLRGLSDSPLLEVEVILSYVLKKPRAWIVTHPDTELDAANLEHANHLIGRLIKGEPLPYLTGTQAFYGLDFIVTPDVLIPRPETELLVEECIKWLEKNLTKRLMADVGTGSGIIAVTLADRFCDLLITAIDISEKALTVAKNNATQFHVEQRIVFLQNDLLTNHQAKYDLIAANLPYIPQGIMKGLKVSKFEPTLALNGGMDGLELIRRLLEQIRKNIDPGGLIILEFQYDQAKEVEKLAKAHFPSAKISILNDLAGHPRISKIQL